MMRNIEKQDVWIAFTKKSKALYMLSRFQRRIWDPVKHL